MKNRIFFTRLFESHPWNPATDLRESKSKRLRDVGLVWDTEVTEAQTGQN